MLRRLLAAAIVLVAFVALIAVSWPQLFGLQRTVPFVQLVSLRGAIVVGCFVVLALLVFLALLSAKARRFSSSLILVLLLAILINGAVLGTRGTSQAGLGDAVQKRALGDLVVMAWNTLGDAPGAKRIAQLAIDHNVDVLSLPETSASTAEAIAQQMTAAGSPMQVVARSHSPELIAQSTALLVRADLGPYQADTDVGPNNILPTIVAASDSGPPLVAVHAIAPLPDVVPQWRTDLEWLSEHCDDPETIMLGDFNATLDHMSGLPNASGEPGEILGGCRDAAVEAGSGAVGTWPSNALPLLGSPIDHVLLGRSWQVDAFEVITSQDELGSDHRPVIAVLSRAEPEPDN